MQEKETIQTVGNLCRTGKSGILTPNILVKRWYDCD